MVRVLLIILSYLWIFFPVAAILGGLINKSHKVYPPAD
jgi:hypothetical protein